MKIVSEKYMVYSLSILNRQSRWSKLLLKSIFSKKLAALWQHLKRFKVSLAITKLPWNFNKRNFKNMLLAWHKSSYSSFVFQRHFSSLRICRGIVRHARRMCLRQARDTRYVRDLSHRSRKILTRFIVILPNYLFAEHSERIQVIIRCSLGSELCCEQTLWWNLSIFQIETLSHAWWIKISCCQRFRPARDYNIGIKDILCYFRPISIPISSRAVQPFWRDWKKIPVMEHPSIQTLAINFILVRIPC